MRDGNSAGDHFDDTAMAGNATAQVAPSRALEADQSRRDLLFASIGVLGLTGCLADAEPIVSEKSSHSRHWDPRRWAVSQPSPLSEPRRPALATRKPSSSWGTPTTPTAAAAPSIRIPRRQVAMTTHCASCRRGTPATVDGFAQRKGLTTSSGSARSAATAPPRPRQPSTRAATSTFHRARTTSAPR